MEHLDANVRQWIGDELFHAVPMRIAVIDREFNIVHANQAFEKEFGDWRDKKCFEAYKDRNSVCHRCPAAQSFQDGLVRVTDEVGYGEDGDITYYKKHTVPISDQSGEVAYLVEMSYDVTSAKQLKQENLQLFEQAPCNMTLLDSDLRIIKTNLRIKRSFGDVEGKYCYQVLKHRTHRCEECPAADSFRDGHVHTMHSVVKNKKGETVHLQVTTAPLGLGDTDREHVLEMAVDVTKTLKLEDELKIAHIFLQTLIATSMDGIVAVDDRGKVTICNAAARKLLQLKPGTELSGEALEESLPNHSLYRLVTGDGRFHLPDTTMKTLNGEDVAVRLVGEKLESGGRLLGAAIFIQDQTELKLLEKEKLEAERLAAVGQTVAGLTHGLKNLLTGLEGGMYMMSTGLKKGSRRRIDQGWEMLDRNIVRITKFVKDFLSFSKGRVITVESSDPVAIVEEVVELYNTKASEHGITLTWEAKGEIAKANLDYEGIHESLTNLVGNAIDSCLMSDEDTDLNVRVSVFEQDGAICYEVRDNGCGMDYEVKRKVFTTFFTTKGLGGTGLGLLMTRKIVQEHGGHIDVESTPGEGTIFTIRLPRVRLPELKNENGGQAEEA